MIRARVIFALWATFLLLTAVVEWTIFTRHTPNYYLLVVQPAFAIGGTLTIALFASARTDPGTRTRTRVIPDLSLPSALVGIAVGTMLWGAFIGEWLLLIGAGLLVLGLGGVVHEVLEARRLADATPRPGPDRPEDD
jgi:hypothetical protein